ncbi:pentapeptide repeat-containing protein, partial [Candidatus Dependentiae bacterium]|nr:pentapeptide repeat-containing protein [Candidatus Dependentiae bacterium]
IINLFNNPDKKFYNLDGTRGEMYGEIFKNELIDKLEYADKRKVRSAEVLHKIIRDLFSKQLKVRIAEEANNEEKRNAFIQNTINKIIAKNNVINNEELLYAYSLIEKNIKDGFLTYEKADEVAVLKNVDVAKTLLGEFTVNTDFFAKGAVGKDIFDLTRCTVNSTLNFISKKNAVLAFEKPVKFNDIKLTTHMNFKGEKGAELVFKNDVTFDNSIFEKGSNDKKVMFSNVKFENDLNFRNVTINKGVTLDFENVSIDGTLDLSGVKLEGWISFINVSYKALKLGDNFYLKANKSNTYRTLGIKNVTSVLELKKYILNKVLVSSVEGKDVLIEKINIVEGMDEKSKASERAEIYMQLKKDKMISGENFTYENYIRAYSIPFNLAALKDKTIEAPSYDVIDFSHALIGGTLTFKQDLNNSPVLCPVDFNGIKLTTHMNFNGDSKEKPLVFKEDVSFEGAEFKGGTFSKTVLFKNVTFEKNLNFNNANINKDVTIKFENVKINGYVTTAGIKGNGIIDIINTEADTEKKIEDAFKDWEFKNK